MISVYDLEELINESCLGQEGFETLVGALMKLDLVVEKLMGVFR